MLKRFPDNPRLQYLKAALHYLRGEEAAALALARKIVEEHPAFEEGLMVAAELAFLTALAGRRGADRAAVSPRRLASRRGRC